ncbi:glycerol-3-phosphate acyltransferase [Scheffersomyces amazonensis]|uniref:glycerol-3-phosphate acyltransferase n=1 Tax=Scheffersomyces amazonensis TaxID=1078765 RepID=UPI00315D967F
MVTWNLLEGTNPTADHDIANSDFDINILDHALSSPTIPLTFPLPTDKDTYVPSEGNEKVQKSFSLLLSSFRLFLGVDVDNIYTKAEYRYATNKYNSTFHKKFEEYMNNKLERDDKKLDELIYQLVNQELNLNLIKGADYQKRFQEVKKFMVDYYKQENAKNLPVFKSIEFIQTAYITVMSVMRKMFPRGIWCSRDELSKLYRQYLDNPMSIVFLPSHQTVVAGENLNVAVFGTFLKNLGAIFIKRSFNNELYTERNLNNVVEFLLLNKINFEVFIEGTRSRDGKLLLPKYGILKQLTNIFLKQRYTDSNPEFDLLFQPVSITYERIYESDGYLKELVGSDKKQESMTNILYNGVSNLLRNKEIQPIVWGKDEYNDNSERTLSGKIFFKLGNRFHLSEFLEQQQAEDSNFISGLPNYEIVDSGHVNLKKLGFKILHEINRISYLPEVSIVGTTLQVYYYYYFKDHLSSNNGKPIVIKIEELLPVFKLVSQLLYNENIDSVTNSQILSDVLTMTDKEKIELIRDQIIDFFRFIQVHKTKNIIRVINPIELLYYKNLSIHLIIQRCLIGFIVLYLNDAGIESNHIIVTKIYYILTGFLKNEFLFDYNYNERYELTFILEDFVKQGVLKESINDDGIISFVISDKQYLQMLANLAIPFVESYSLLIENIFSLTNSKASKYESEKKKLEAGQGEINIHDEDDLKFPDTKGLLKHVIGRYHDRKTNTIKGIISLESINKQYLLSDLYYLNNLQVIGIVKNKAKTKAYVKILNERDLRILHQFLLQILGKVSTSQNHLIKNEINLNYVIDIIDKRFNRDFDEISGRSKL